MRSIIWIEKTKETNKRKLYQSKIWKHERLVFLKKHPDYKHCLEKGLNNEATEVDHIIRHQGNVSLFFDQGNWQALCKACHSSKTAKEIRPTKKVKKEVNHLNIQKFIQS